jgi:chemotaxis methyl-accepting protein methylase/chemotaxis response regulator CheB
MNFSQEDKNKIYKLAESLIGSKQDGESQLDVIPINVWKRMQHLSIVNLDSYFSLINTNGDERAELISALTIHTTYWFREMEHFKNLKEYVLANLKQIKSKGTPFCVWSAASSTGEEVYSLALVLESICKLDPSFDYKILGTDIDPKSTNVAKKAIYDAKEVRSIPEEYQKLIMVGTGPTQGFFTLVKSIRNKVEFQNINLMNIPYSLDKFDIVFCRNVLIYFAEVQQIAITQELSKKLSPGGRLYLGHTEIFSKPPKGINSLGRSIYERQKEMIGHESHIKRILYIDDEENLLEIFSLLFQNNKSVKTFTANSTYSGFELLKNEKIDLLLLDLNLPNENGEVFLRKIRDHGFKTPVIVISGALDNNSDRFSHLTTFGVVDLVEKMDFFSKQLVYKDKILEIIHKNKTAAKTFSASVSIDHNHFRQPELILIGASTGGTEALMNLLGRFNQNSPPVVVIQHIEPRHARAFARRLSEVSGLKLDELDSTSIVMKRGHLYMATEDYHVAVKKNTDGNFIFYKSFMTKDTYVHRPSIDYAFLSAANLNFAVTSVLLTGMGKDGAQGMLAHKNNGCYTLAQDEESCIVYGMPKEAALIGGVSFVGNVLEIRMELERFLTTYPVKRNVA